MFICVDIIVAKWEVKDSQIDKAVCFPYAETLLKKDKNLENDWLIGDESWRDGKNTYQVHLTYYADADAEKEGRESEYQYTIHFDEIEGYLIKSEDVPEKEYGN